MTIRVKHSTNAGGAVSNRDAKGEQERKNIAILQEKWPGVFMANGRRQNEVIFCWGNRKNPDGSDVGGGPPGRGSRKKSISSLEEKEGSKKKTSLSMDAEEGPK